MVNSVKEALSETDLDEASKILIAYNTIAMQEILAKEMDCGSAVQTVLLMSMRTLADYLANEKEAIYQIRTVADNWERQIFIDGRRHTRRTARPRQAA
jgi:hypothetical protein